MKIKESNVNFRFLFVFSGLRFRLKGKVENEIQNLVEFW